MRKIRIKAGPEAYAEIKKYGLRPSRIKAIASAAGGPKWFTVYGLTKYIIGDLIRNQNHQIHLIGASVGSWQMTAAACSDPRAALERLQKAYAQHQYSDKPDEHEISMASKGIIESLINDETDYILNNPSRLLHVITTQGSGWINKGQKFKMYAGFAYLFLQNARKRAALETLAKRVLFSNSEHLPYSIVRDNLSTIKVLLKKENLIPALRASGSIPFMMEGIENIPYAPNGTYWDGGLVDYHITLPYNIDGLVLHPHFLPQVYQGWLDKKLPWSRYATEEYMSKVILVHPSEAYVASLPKKQISDMKDFFDFDTDQEGRIQYWNEISARSEALGMELKELISSGEISNEIERY